MLYGILTAKGELIDGTVRLRVESERTATFAAGLVHEFFGREAVICVPPQGGRCREVGFRSTAAARLVSDMLMDGRIVPPCKCAGCQAAYFQGTFLACGRISDPSKQFCLEFSLGNRCEIVLRYWESLGIYPKIAHRENETLLYFRNSGAIEDFFAMAGMNQTAFSMMNSKIENEIRNNANRVVNCETNNIEKAVGASGRQIAAIERLAAANLLSSLPEELERTAKLRLQYRDLSLSQLAAVSVPPMSKSGLSHRMERIIRACDEMMGEKEKG